MQLRQVQAHEAPRRRLREVRRRGHPVQGAPRAPGPHRAGHAGRPHLVPEEPAEPDRQPARHDPEGPREGPLLRALHRHSTPARRRCRQGSCSPRSSYRKARRGVRRRPFDAGMGAEAVRELLKDIDLDKLSRRAARRDAAGDQRGQAQEARQAPEGRRGVPQLRQPARVDDPRRHPGAAARPAAAGAARRRPLRHLRPERPLPPRHQPQQPPEAAHGAQRARTSSSATRSACCRRRSTRCSTTAAAARPSPAPTSARSSR